MFVKDFQHAKPQHENKLNVKRRALFTKRRNGALYNLGHLLGHY